MMWLLTSLMTHLALARVAIVGGKAQTTRRGDVLSIEARGATSYAWELFRVSNHASLLEKTALASVSRNPRFFVLPPFSLEASKTYVLQVKEAHDDDDDEQDESNSSSTHVVLSVERGSVVATIDGGQERTVDGWPVTLSAAKSFDEDALNLEEKRSPLTLFWHCRDCVSEGETAVVKSPGVVDVT
eukprot:CAMPEP_0118917584 /NCGR_PEP_ID=MMETSP1166-20130328/17412_1 /TAXON_ID=1104430 /ORGANISM="Chrysoreinhardia sp, Strain CCMP3193" /LENGTH=185 /DNA_ID=CAMNT_0006857777 /DNA_START=1 /DNA_END=555 /DNA_ORIENTATION=+